MNRPSFDANATVRFLFLGGPPPAAPGAPPAACGFDPDPPGSPGDLGCEEYGSSECGRLENE